jgi:uncharacterized membrane protein YwaF
MHFSVVLSVLLVALHLTPRTSESGLTMDAVVLKCVTQFNIVCFHSSRCQNVVEKHAALR